MNEHAERAERRAMERARRASDLEVAEAKLRSWSLATRGDSVIEYVELVIYAGVSLVLVMGSLALLVDSVKTFLTTLDLGVLRASTQMLSVLLLVFVFVELLGAVRTTIRERRLVAEPFLLVGIIASIKEIVLVAGTQRGDEVTPELFREAMVEVGILSVVVLLLAIATVLLRSKAPADNGRPPVLDDRGVGIDRAAGTDED
jgi:uncharacterized membrane protein (DUF373 family)